VKSYPSKILYDINKLNQKIVPILFYGNEEGLISSTIKSIYNLAKKNHSVSEISYFDYKNQESGDFLSLINNSSLFSKINFIVLTNPQEKLIDDLNNIKNLEDILLINGEGLQAKSKLRSHFDRHKSYISVPCYQLDKNRVKKIIDDFLSKNNLSLDKNAYWYLVENISYDYLALSNELEKIVSFGSLTISVKILKNLISQKSNSYYDNFFFYCAAGNSERVIKEINLLNKSIEDSYGAFLSLKRFLNILASAVVNKDEYSAAALVSKFLPKYLFLKKDIFEEIINKTNIKKINKINKMIQKTEILIRQNSNMHREVLERFMLNVVRVLK
tara:strand:- start:1290 stop:2279 length:990 start_codon:yes stop_codon:yes gene_type:complete